MRILVTGSRGLVGKELIILNNDDYEFISISSNDVDLRDLSRTCDFIENNLPIDGIINLAANVGGIFKNLSFPVEMTEDNILINLNILKSAHKYNINRVICCLSTCIFPNAPPNFPMTHEMIHEGPPHYSNQGYAYAKRITDILCKAYRDEYKREYFCVVPTNIYGRFDHFEDIANSHVIPSLIKKIHDKKNENEILMRGEGTPLRQFIYSEDVAKLILWAFKYYKQIENPLILCPPNSEISIKRVVELISKNIGFKGFIVFDCDTNSNGQKIKTVETPECIKNFEFTSFEEGIKKTIDWYRSQPYH
jgi:GDP-L-fucose synthase